MPPAPSTFSTRYGPSRPSSPGPCAGARNSVNSSCAAPPGATVALGSADGSVSPARGGGPALGGRGGAAGNDVSEESGSPGGTAGAATGAGTVTGRAQCGHLALRPAAQSLTLSLWPQWGQAKDSISALRGTARSAPRPRPGPPPF